MNKKHTVLPNKTLIKPLALKKKTLATLVARLLAVKFLEGIKGYTKRRDKIYIRGIILKWVISYVGFVWVSKGV